MRRSLRAFCRGWLTGGRSHVAPGGTPGPSRPFCRSGENLVMEGTRLAGNVSFKEPGHRIETGTRYDRSDVAQEAERPAVNREVGGSWPSVGARQHTERGTA